VAECQNVTTIILKPEQIDCATAGSLRRLRRHVRALRDVARTPALPVHIAACRRATYAAKVVAVADTGHTALATVRNDIDAAARDRAGTTILPVGCIRATG
jgi:hypothetical protein